MKTKGDVPARWDVSSLAYQRATRILDDEQSRLYRLAVGYLVAVAAAGTWAADKVADDKIIPWEALCAASLISTFYLVLYSYSSVFYASVLEWLRMIQFDAERKFGADAAILRNEGYVLGRGKALKYINVTLTLWRLFPLAAALAFPVLAYVRGGDPWICSLSLLVAVVGGGVAFLASIVKVARVARRIVREENQVLEPKARDTTGSEGEP